MGTGKTISRRALALVVLIVIVAIIGLQIVLSEGVEEPGYPTTSGVAMLMKQEGRRVHKHLHPGELTFITKVADHYGGDLYLSDSAEVFLSYHPSAPNRMRREYLVSNHSSEFIHISHVSEDSDIRDGWDMFLDTHVTFGRESITNAVTMQVQSEEKGVAFTKIMIFRDSSRGVQKLIDSGTSVDEILNFLRPNLWFTMQVLYGM